MDNEIKTSDILEPFTAVEPLGAGGQKVVFIVTDSRFGRCVLKIGRYSSQSSLERIRREVNILNDIHSVYFPRQYKFQVVDNERFYIIEELLDGATLDMCFARFDSEKAIAEFGCQILDGLTLLWERRVVHRDLKPRNIIITETGPRIIDLGIARLLDATSITNTQAPYGPCTPEYASIEQLENRKRDIDWRSDQFSLGIILTQLVLNGNHPFHPRVVGEGENIPNNIIFGKWARANVAAHASRGLFTLLATMLGREPYQRYRFQGDVRHNLEEIRKGEL